MATFTQRTTAPTQSDVWFYSKNPFHWSGYGLPNCTCYAWGRFAELMNSQPTLSRGNAENWYGYNDGYSRGQTPKLGAIICWRKGEAGNGSDGAGHVAVVEQINADGSIVISQSGWGASEIYWRSSTDNKNGNWGLVSPYVFQGFIYHPIDFVDDSIKPVSGNRYLTRSEMETNALYIWNYLGSRGWSRNAVAGMLGNMETESTINPGIWQGLDEGNTSGGFGLCQWTPATKYLDWCDKNWLTPDYMDSALKRIEYELANGLQYYPTDSYPETFAGFKVSTKDPYYLAMAFLANYERPADRNQPNRGTQAEAWYEFLGGVIPEDPGTPDTPIPPYKPSRKMPLLLLSMATRRRK